MNHTARIPRKSFYSALQQPVLLCLVVIALSCRPLLAQGTLVFSFETSAETHSPAVTLTTGSTATQTTTGATDGTYALALSFPALNYPSITFHPSTSYWDWSAYDTLTFDIINPSSDQQNMKLSVTDGTNSRIGQYLVAPGTTTISLPLVDVQCIRDYGMSVCPGFGMAQLVNQSGTVNAAHITSFQLYISKPSFPEQLTIDNIRVRSLNQYATSYYSGIIDQFGQSTLSSWTGKITSSAALTADGSSQLTTYTGSTYPSTWDTYGGVLGSGFTDPTPSTYFHVEQIGSKWWLIDPSGNPFYGIGIDAVRWTNSQTETFVTGTNRAAMFASLPSSSGAYAPYYGTTSGKTWFDFYHANVFTKYGSTARTTWKNLTLARMKAWRFNLVESPTSDFQAGNVPYELRPSISGSYATVTGYGGSMPDPYDPAFTTAAQTVLNPLTSAWKTDQWLVGYFVDNEMPWGAGGAALPADQYALIYSVFKLGSSSYAKQALVNQMQTKYTTIAALNSAWGTSFASFSTLLSSAYTFPTTPTASALTDLSAMLRAYADQYYSTVRSVLKTGDPNHLYLGSRYADFRLAPVEVVNSCAAYCDVVSINWYQGGMDPTIWANYGAAGHPSMISEFHFTSPDGGVFGTGEGPVVSEAARATAYTAFFNSVAANADIVAMNWFAYIDNPATGAAYASPAAPENSHYGLVSVTDTPWSGLVSAATTANQAIYTTRVP